MNIVLDTGPLSLVSHPKASRAARDCKEWLKQVLTAGHSVFIPEIADYELRRELLRAAKTKSIERLDSLALSLGYLPLTTVAIRKAAEFWADTRNAGRPTATDESLDADVILAAQAVSIPGIASDDVVVATTNPKHLSRFLTATTWEAIQPND